jgi:MFS transporter, DHA3 family, multidrug efflux protein
VSFLVTSVISGLLVAAGEMFYVLLLGMVVLVLSVVHLAFVRVDERHEGAPETQSSSTDQHADWIYAARWRSSAACQGCSR